MVTVEDVATGDVLGDMDPKGYVAGGMNFTPDGQQVIWSFGTMSNLGSNVIFQNILGPTTKGFSTPAFGSRNASHGGLVLLPSGDQLATIIVREDLHGNLIGRDLVVWDFERDRVLLRLALSSETTRMAGSPDGARLAFSDQKTIRILDTKSLQIIGVIPTPTPMEDLSGFSPDGQLVAASDDTGLVLWSVSTGKMVARLPTGEISLATFTSDGLWLVTFGFSGAVTVWAIQP